jgi:hypothetical protein
MPDSCRMGQGGTLTARAYRAKEDDNFSAMTRENFKRRSP